MREPAKAARWPPGRRMRRHSSHNAGGGTKESQLVFMNPTPPAGMYSRSPEAHRVIASATRFGLVADKP